MESDRLLVAAVFCLALPAPAISANGSDPAERATVEYREAIARAEKDYTAANRRCEVLKIDLRKLCVHDSAAARDAAVIEAQSKRSRIAPAGR